MDKQTNSPEDWRILAERDITVADYLAANMKKICGWFSAIQR